MKSQSRGISFRSPNRSRRVSPRMSPRMSPRIGDKSIAHRSPRVKRTTKNARNQPTSMRRHVGGRTITAEAPLYVLYVVWNNIYEIISIEDHLQTATALSADITPNMWDPPDDVIRRVRENVFIQTVVPDGTEQPSDLIHINPDDHEGTFSYELEREQNDPNYRPPVQRPVYFRLHDNGLIRRIHYDEEMLDRRWDPAGIRSLDRTNVDMLSGILFTTPFGNHRDNNGM